MAWTVSQNYTVGGMFDCSRPASLAEAMIDQARRYDQIIVSVQQITRLPVDVAARRFSAYIQTRGEHADGCLRRLAAGLSDAVEAMATEPRRPGSLVSG